MAVDKEKPSSGIRRFIKRTLLLGRNIVIGLLVLMALSLTNVLISMLIARCREPVESPEIVLQKYYKAIENEDFETAIELMEIGGKDEDIKRRNEEYYRKEMKRWSKGFLKKGGFRKIVNTNRIKITSHERKIKFLGIRVWTKDVKFAEMYFGIYVNNGFYVAWSKERLGIGLKAVFIMTKDGWKVLGMPEPEPPNGYDLIDQWLSNTAPPDVDDDPIKPGEIIIFHVEYDPPGQEPDDESITLKNIASQSVDISGWKLTDGEGTHTIDEGETIAPGETWTVYGRTYNPTRNIQELFLNNTHDSVEIVQVFFCKLCFPDGVV